MTSSIVMRDHPRGPAGVKVGMKEIAEGMDRDRYHPLVIEWTRHVLMLDPDTLTPRGRPDPTKIAFAIFKAIKNGTRISRPVGFVRDPVDAELIMSAVVLLCLDPLDRCAPAGDCDDQVRLLGTALLCAGVPVMLQNRFYKGQGSSHVVVLYDADPRLSGKWTCFDPSLDSGICSTAPYESEIKLEVHMGRREGGTFVGIGDPPPAQLGAAESAVWTQQVQAVHDALTASAADLRTQRAKRVQVRAALGLPAVDPPPSQGGDVQNLPPLAQYVNNLAWTQSAQDAIGKLLSTADFATNVLGEALAGKRPMYFLDNDILIGAIGGEPYFLQMRKNDQGVFVPSYVDPKTQDTSGQIGIAPIIIGAGIVIVVALSLAAAWNMDKIIDLVAQRSHDAMLSEMANYQQQMITSGKATPEQVQKLIDANTKFAKETKPKPSGPSWPLILLALGLGIAGGVVAAKTVTVSRPTWMPARKKREEMVPVAASRARLYSRGGAARAFAF